MSRINNYKRRVSKLKFQNKKQSKKKNFTNNTKKFSKKKKMNVKKKGGKPIVGENIYTYFIIAHGLMSIQETRQPIIIPVNSSIITLTNAGVSTNIDIAHEIVHFYLNNNRLFKKMDMSKKKMEDVELFISQKLSPHVEDSQSINIRNHVKDSHMNDIGITFFRNIEYPVEEYLGIIRYNHTTYEIEHYDINALKYLESVNKLQYEIFTLNMLLHYIFDTPNLQEQIKFDNHVTIIPILCRKFNKELENNEEANLLIRSISKSADEVPSFHEITELDSSIIDEMEKIDTYYNLWLKYGTKVLLKNGSFGIIKKFYEVASDNSTYIDIEFDIGNFKNNTNVYIKGLDSDLNGKLGRIQGDFNKRTKTWPVMIDGILLNISYANLEVCYFNKLTTVKIVGLNSRSDLNDKKCTIIDNFDNTRKRWPILIKTEKGEERLLLNSQNLFYYNTKQLLKVYREEIIEILENTKMEVKPKSAALVVDKPQAASTVVTKPTKKGIDYSRFDNIQDSDDE